MFYRISTLHQSDGSNDSESYDYYSTIADALAHHTPGVYDESYPDGYWTWTSVSTPEPCDVIEPHWCGGVTRIHIPGVLHTCAEPERAPHRRRRPVW